MPTELTDAHWRALHELTVEAMTHAYAPYSRFKVGTAALVGDGRLISGCNVESAGYDITPCVECGLTSELAHTGGGCLVTFTCVDTHDRTLAPCGRYRQPPNEHAADGIVLAMPSGMIDIDEVLPDRFCADDVKRIVSPQS